MPGFAIFSSGHVPQKILHTDFFFKLSCNAYDLSGCFQAKKVYLYHTINLKMSNWKFV